MGARDSIGKAPSGNRLRTLHRAPLWLSDVLPEEARRTWPIVLPVAAAGAATATAAVLALDGNTSVQRVDYVKLRLRLLADNQVLEWKSAGK